MQSCHLLKQPFAFMELNARYDKLVPIQETVIDD